MPLIDPEPPITRPRGSGTRRPSRCCCGTVVKPQPNFGLMIAQPTAAGIVTNGWRSEPPASMRQTRFAELSDKRLAMTQPAVPAPTTM